MLQKRCEISVPYWTEIQFIWNAWFRGKTYCHELTHTKDVTYCLSMLRKWNEYHTRRTLLYRCLMLRLLLALGFTVAQSCVGASPREGTYFARSTNVSSEFIGTSSSHSISRIPVTVIRISSDGRLERIIRWPGACAKETIVNWGWA